MIVSAPHIPLHRIERAVAQIRLMVRRKRDDYRCGFPDDLGCETQLYLGRAMMEAYPGERFPVIAQCCGVAVGDCWFFATLLDLATHSAEPWMDEAIVAEATRCLLGLPQPYVRRVELASLATFPRGTVLPGAAGAPAIAVGGV